jgi:hypothetical protein
MLASPLDFILGFGVILGQLSRLFQKLGPLGHIRKHVKEIVSL